MTICIDVSTITPGVFQQVPFKTLWKDGWEDEGLPSNLIGIVRWPIGETDEWIIFSDINGVFRSPIVSERDLAYEHGQMRRRQTLEFKKKPSEESPSAVERLEKKILKQLNEYKRRFDRIDGLPQIYLNA